MTGRDLGVAKLSAVQQGCLEHASDFNLTYRTSECPALGTQLQAPFCVTLAGHP